MRAGLLRETLIIEALTEEETDWGNTRKAYKEVFRCRAQRKRQSIVQGEENAKEVFLGQIAIFTTRKYPQITYDCHIKWAGCTWEVKMIEPNGNELTVTLKKSNG